MPPTEQGIYHDIVSERSHAPSNCQFWRAFLWRPLTAIARSATDGGEARPARPNDIICPERVDGLDDRGKTIQTAECGVGRVGLLRPSPRTPHSAPFPSFLLALHVSYFIRSSPPHSASMAPYSTLPPPPVRVRPPGRSSARLFVGCAHRVVRLSVCPRVRPGFITEMPALPHRIRLFLSFFPPIC